MVRIIPQPVQPGITNVFAVAELVTPERAASMLASSPGNRRATRIDVYAEMMKRGEWALVPDCIGIDEEGRLLNGHNRLEAVIKSGISVLMMVIYNIKRADMAKIDVGKSRTAGDMLSFLFEFIGNYNIVAGAVRMLIAYERENCERITATGMRLVTNANIISYVRDNIDEIIGIDYKTRLPYSPSALLASRVVLSRVSKDTAKGFFASLKSEMNPYEGYPTFTLNKRLGNISYKGDDGRIAAFALTIKAWNFWRQNKACKQLKWLDSEPFPKPI